MRRRAILPLLVVLLLAAILFLWDLPHQNRQEQREETALQLSKLDPELVDTIRIHQAGALLSLVRHQGHWWLRSPVDERADDKASSGMISALCRAHAMKVVQSEVDTTALEAYGLGGIRRPAYWIELIEAGQKPQVYWIGRTNPSDEGSYLRVGGRRDVLLVRKELAQLARTSFEALRIYDLFDYTIEDIPQIELHTDRASFEARRNDAGLWFTMGEHPRQLKRRDLYALIYDLVHTRISRYVADDVSDSVFYSYGLSQPVMDLRFLAKGDSHRVRLGNVDERGVNYARRDEERTLITISSKLLESGDKSYEELLETNPVPLNYTRLDSIRVIWKTGEKVTAIPGYRREWRLRPPEGFKGDKESLLVPAQNLRYGVEELKSDSHVLLSSPDQVHKFLQVVKVRCELYWPDKTVAYDIGWRKDEEQNWLHIIGDETVYRIPRDLFFRLRGALLSVKL
ncbi:MAG TPA: DUF4340 domain-containing protein, partial [Candidatus Krumholzibacteria bacterium]|nr:DUF4340 domain-containing protein [Candidatus Krumholzibacteria bacterium]